MIATDRTVSLAHRGEGATVHRLRSSPRVSARARARRKLRRRILLIQHLAGVAAAFVEGADPRDAIWFLRALRERCAEAIRAAST